MPPADAAAVERAVRSSAAAMIGLAVHELNNRLAVMRETVGLLEDLARAGKKGAEPTARAHAALDDQVGRALNIVTALAGLGTALGAAGEAFDAARALDDLLGLTERWARQRSLRVERDLPAGLPRAAGDPALFLCLAHRLLARCAEGLGGGGTLLVRAARDGRTLRVTLAPRGAAAAGGHGGGEDEIDRELARRLGGEVVFDTGGVRTVVLQTSG